MTYSPDRLDRIETTLLLNRQEFDAKATSIFLALGALAERQRQSYEQSERDQTAWRERADRDRAEWLERADRDRAEWQQRMVQIEAQQAENAKQIAANYEQIALSREGINNLQASILELRNIVADLARNQRET